MSKWSAILKTGTTLLKGGKYVVNNPATRSLADAAIHPQRTLIGAGRAIKTATVGAGIGYLGWETLVNDKPVVRTVADAVLGKGAVDSAITTTENAVQTFQDTARDVQESVSGLNGAVQQSQSVFGGISDFLKNICGGNGADMFGNFFSNISRGNVSGLSVVGLLAAGLMIFGRFGWLGKIGGALLAMMLVGNNSRMAQVQEQPTENRQQSGGRHR